MSILHAKRWHWLAAGICVGLLLGGMRLFWGPAYRQSTARTLSQDLFEMAVMGKPIASWWTLRLERLVVHPPEREGDQWVTGRFVEERTVAYAGVPARQVRLEGAFKYRAATPYRAKHALPEGRSVDSVRSYIEGAGARSRFAWHEQPGAVLGLWTAGAMIVIGGIWPVVLSLVRGAGLGFDPSGEEIEAAIRSVAAVRRAAEPALDQREADRQTEAYVDVLKQQAMGGDEPVAPAGDLKTSAAPAEAVRPLAGGAVEPGRSLPDPEDKQFRGEFYPTEVHSPTDDRKA